MSRTDLIEFAEDKEITIQAKGLMLYFLAHADDDGMCDLRREQITKDMGIGKATLNKYINELEETDNIEAIRNRKINGRFINNAYWVNWVIE